MQQGGAPLVYYAFDLLELDGEPLVDLPLRERRARLEELLDRRNQTVRLSETFDDGEALLEAATAQGLEGIMAKRADSRYFEGRRTRDWLKIKTHGRQEFLIAGYTQGGGRRASTFGSLDPRGARGRRADVRRERRHRLQRRRDPPAAREAEAARRETSPFADAAEDAARAQGRDRVGRAEARRRGRVRASGRTTAGCAQPSYQGLRDDKEPEEVHREEPEPLEDRDPQGHARAEALEPRQGLLARRGDHEGRPAPLLPRGRARARAAPEGPPVHDEALSRRLERQVLLPEGRADAHAGLDPDLPRARRRRARSRASGSGSSSRSSTTSSRSCGW